MCTNSQKYLISREIDKHLRSAFLYAHIPLKNIANCDEMFLYFNPKLLGFRLDVKNNSNPKLKCFGNSKEGLTVLNTLIADGGYLKPFLVFKKSVSGETRKQIDEEFFFVTSAPEGNMREGIFLLYIREVR
jgi:hypothetical protein